MSNKRALVFVNESYYHVYNRGIDRRHTFTNKREYTRALELLTFYQYTNIPIRYSRFIEAPEKLRQSYYGTMQNSGKLVEVVAYCLMPNHFHLLIKQRKEKGIASYVSNFINAYTKYFNTKYQRIGPLFQGVFKAVFVETDEQLIHLTRYIHLNPVSSRMITTETLPLFPWSSHPHYLKRTNSELIEKTTVSTILEMIPNYEKFIIDQIAYAQELEKIKHMTFEYE